MHSRYVLDNSKYHFGQWLADNAYRYALCRLSGTTDITGYIYEPWHFRYIRVDIGSLEAGLVLCSI